MKIDDEKYHLWTRYIFDLTAKSETVHVRNNLKPQ